MADVLIRDLPDEVLAAVDERAAMLGLSRSEYLRRRLRQDLIFPTHHVEVADLAGFAETFKDLADSDVMAEAWR